MACLPSLKQTLIYTDELDYAIFRYIYVISLAKDNSFNYHQFYRTVTDTLRFMKITQLLSYERYFEFLYTCESWFDSLDSIELDTFMRQFEIQ